MTTYTLTETDEKVLRAIGRYHYATVEQLTRTLFSKSSRTYASEILARLTKHSYLYKNLDGPRGIWSLTGKGRSFLEGLGVSLLPRVRHNPIRTGRFWDHILSVNDALITCELYGRHTDGVELAGMLHERTFHRGPERVELILAGKRISTPVAADGWVDLRIGGYQSCLWLEVDRDTEHIHDWIAKISSIIEYYGSGRYEERFGTDSLTVLGIAVPKTGKSAQRRMQELLGWTESTLKELGKAQWADVFRFTAVDPARVWVSPKDEEDLTPTDYFHSAHWLTPFDSRPRPLLGYEEAA
jgi:hypothetical protein